jgi:hypothetical protein
MKILPWVFLLIIVSILHPFVDAGSDSDDAIEIGVSEIIQGRNPYKAHTHLRNPLTPLPGWILLNTPSVFLGAHLWCLVWVFLCCRNQPLQFSIIVILLSGKTIIQGVDYAANACCILWACSLLKTNVSPSGSSDTSLELERTDSYFDWDRGNIYSKNERMGKSPNQPAVCNRNLDHYDSRFFWAGILLLLPALWVSNAAYHGILAMPFLLTGIYKEKQNGRI